MTIVPDSLTGQIHLYGVLQNANTFTSDIFVRIEEYEKSLSNMTATITGYCSATFCPSVITDTQARFQLQPPFLWRGNLLGVPCMKLVCLWRSQNAMN